MFQWLRNWLRPVRCHNFDCTHQWNKVCRAEKLDMGLYDKYDASSLMCYTFKQVSKVS